MKRIKLLSVITFCAVLVSCNEARSLLQIVNCKYDLENVVSPTIAGVSLSNITNISQLNITDLAKLTLAFTSKSLPVNLTVNVKATNPGSVAATVQKLDWALDLEQTEILTGSVNQIISIPASGSTLIPFNVGADMMQLFKSETKDNLLNLALSLVNLGDSSSKVSMRIKPTITIAGQPLSTGFITLGKTVSSN